MANNEGKKVESWDEEVTNVAPKKVDNWDEEVADEPVKKKVQSVFYPEQANLSKDYAPIVKPQTSTSVSVTPKSVSSPTEVAKVAEKPKKVVYEQTNQQVAEKLKEISLRQKFPEYYTQEQKPFDFKEASKQAISQEQAAIEQQNKERREKREIAQIPTQIKQLQEDKVKLIIDKSPEAKKKLAAADAVIYNLQKRLDKANQLEYPILNNLNKNAVKGVQSEVNEYLQSDPKLKSKIENKEISEVETFNLVTNAINQKVIPLQSDLETFKKEGTVKLADDKIRIGTELSTKQQKIQALASQISNIQNNYLKKNGYEDVANQFNEAQKKIQKYQPLINKANSVVALKQKELDALKLRIDGYASKVTDKGFNGTQQEFDDYKNAVEDYNETLAETNKIYSSEEFKNYQSDVDNFNSLLQKRNSFITGLQNTEYPKLQESFKKEQADFDNLITQYKQFDKPEINDRLNQYFGTLEKLNGYDKKLEQAKTALPYVEVLEKAQKEFDATGLGGDFADIGGRAINGLIKSANSIIASPFRMAASFSDAFGVDKNKYHLSEMIADYIENPGGQPMFLTKKSNNLYDSNTDKINWGVMPVLGSLADNLGLLVTLAVTGKYGTPLLTSQLEAQSVNLADAALAAERAKAMMTITPAFMASYGDSYKSAKDAGFEGSGALMYGSTMALLEGLTEMIIPDKELIFGKDIKGVLLKDFIKNYAKGGKYAVGQLVHDFAYNALGESTEEFISMAGETIGTAIGSLTSDKIKTSIPTINEITTTGLTSGILGGIPGISGTLNEQSMTYYLGISEIAKDFNNAKGMLDELKSKGAITEERFDKLVTDAQKYQLVMGKVPDGLSKLKQVAVVQKLIQVYDLQEQMDDDKTNVINKINAEKIKGIQKEIEGIIDDKDFDKKAAEQINEEMDSIQEVVKPELVKFTSPTNEKYGTINRNDGKGIITLTKEEFLNEQANLQQQVGKGAKPETIGTETEEVIAPTGEAVIDKKVEVPAEITWQSEQEAIDSDTNLTPEKKQQKKVEATAKALEGLDKETIRNLGDGGDLERFRETLSESDKSDWDKLMAMEFDKTAKPKDIQKLRDKFKLLEQEYFSKNFPTSKSVSEAYHSDKAAGKETELTKAVEELLGKPTEKTEEVKKEEQPIKQKQNESNNITADGGLYKPPSTEKEINAEEKRIANEEARTGIRTGALPIEKIKVRPKIFQFKSIDEESGVNKSEKLEGEFDSNLAGTIGVWQDINGEIGEKGDVYVVDGHHRMELAQRSGKKDMNVFYIDAPTSNDAKIIAAKANISQGRGTAIDAAKVYRSATPEQLKNFKPKSKIGKDGEALSKLSDSLFNLVVDGKISIERGILLSQGKDATVQESVYREIKRVEGSGAIKMKNSTIKEYIDSGNSSKKETEKTYDLFGESEQEKVDINSRMELLGDVRDKLIQDKNVFGAAARNADLLNKVEQNKIDAEVNEGLSKEAAENVAIFDALKNTSEMSSVINEAVDKYKNAKTRQEKNAVKSDLYSKIKETASNVLNKKSSQKSEKQKPTESAKKAKLKEGLSRFKAETQEAVDAADKVAQSLKSAGIKVEVIDNQADVDKLSQRRGIDSDFQGVFFSDKNNGIIYLNRTKLNGKWGKTIVWHEGTHPILNIIRNTNPKLYNSLLKGVEIAKQNKANKLQGAVDWAKENYEKDGQDTVNDELLTEIIARIANNQIKLQDLPKTLKQQFIDFINELAKALGLKPVLSDTDYVALQKLSAQISDVLKSGRDISEIVGKKNVEKFTTAQLSKGQREEVPLPNGQKGRVIMSAPELKAEVERGLPQFSKSGKESELVNFIGESLKDFTEEEISEQLQEELGYTKQEADRLISESKKLSETKQEINKYIEDGTITQQQAEDFINSTESISERPVATEGSTVGTEGGAEATIGKTKELPTEKAREGKDREGSFEGDNEVDTNLLSKFDEINKLAELSEKEGLSKAEKTKFKELIDSDPSVKEVHYKWKEITDKLIESGDLIKSKGCP